MANMFLLFESIIDLTFEQFQAGVDDLILIDKENNDIFYKNDSFNEVDNYYELYQNYSQENQFRAQYFEQLTPLRADPKSIVELSQVFPNSISGFFGINFPKLDIDENFCVNNNSKFIAFKTYFLAKITASNFSDFKEDCFPNIVFCGDSEKQLLSFGKGKFFSQCLDQFIVLEEYLKTWKTGNFNVTNINAVTTLNISPESNSTMGKYKHERVFTLPKGGSAVFELHIKLGEIRIHILEDNINKKIMIGYIGSHLSI